MSYEHVAEGAYKRIAQLEAELEQMHVRNAGNLLEIDRLGREIAGLVADRHALKSAHIAPLEAELERMRPVVEAAEALAVKIEDWKAAGTIGQPPLFEMFRLGDAIRVYRGES